VTDVQILTIAIALTTSFLAVPTGFPIHDASRASTSAQIAELRTELQSGHSRLERCSDRIEMKLEKVDDNIARIADHGCLGNIRL